MNTLVFLYKQVLDKPLEKRIDAIRSGKKRHIPVVLSADEVKQVLARMEGVPQSRQRTFTAADYGLPRRSGSEFSISISNTNRLQGVPARATKTG